MRLGCEEGGKTGGCQGALDCESARCQWRVLGAAGGLAVPVRVAAVPGRPVVEMSKEWMAEWITDDRTEPVALCPLPHKCWRPPSTSSMPSNGLCAGVASRQDVGHSATSAGLPQAWRRKLPVFRFVRVLFRCNGLSAKHTMRHKYSSWPV